MRLLVVEDDPDLSEQLVDALREAGYAVDLTGDGEEAQFLGDTEPYDAVVLDLRRNGGGSLREAIDCTGLFIDSGPVVQVKDADGRISRHNDEHPGMSWDKPLVVLTSKFSASASEILAGAVQDYGRGIAKYDQGRSANP